MSGEEGLLKACRDGDPRARRELFERMAPRVHAVAAHFFGGDQATASDVTQEVFVKALTRLDQFRGDSAFATWLHRMTVNACLDEKRAQRRLVALDDGAEPVARDDQAERVTEGSREAKAGAAFIVHVDQCGTAVEKAVTARAEGVAGGKRQSLELGLVPTGTPGRWLLRRQWPADGTWALRLSVENHGHATLLARPTAAGTIPSKLLQRAATATEIDAAARGTGDVM